jgi:hypothetical protein
MKEIGPHALFGPADKAIVERLVRPVLIARRIGPTPAGLQYMDDARDHPPVIDPRDAARVRRQMRPDLRELVFRQPEKMIAHQRSPLGAVESRFAKPANHFMGPDPYPLLDPANELHLLWRRNF